MSNISATITQTLNNGLAIYSVGEGQPVLLMPYPHGFSVAPVSESALAEIFVNAGYCVITYDPPGAFRSTRSAQVIMSEMLDCSEETVSYFHINEPIPVICHSMSGLCAIAYTDVSCKACSETGSHWHRVMWSCHCPV